MAVRGGVRAPTSDGKEGLGVDQWTEQLGIVSDLVTPRQLGGRLVPFLAGWIWHRQANGGWGASAGADFVLRDAVTLTAGATGTYGEHMMGETADYLDGYLEVRIGSSGRYRDRYAGRRVEGSLKFQVPLNDDGTRASKALFAGLKVIL